jgi:hypothetical protein
MIDSIEYTINYMYHSIYFIQYSYNYMKRLTDTTEYIFHCT